jgi:hypothetical protein
MTSHKLSLLKTRRVIQLRTRPSNRASCRPPLTFSTITTTSLRNDKKANRQLLCDPPLGANSGSFTGENLSLNQSLTVQLHRPACLNNTLCAKKLPDIDSRITLECSQIRHQTRPNPTHLIVNLQGFSIVRCSRPDRRPVVPAQQFDIRPRTGSRIS